MKDAVEQHRAIREAAAEFVIGRESDLRRTIEAHAQGAEGIDADDVFSTTLRRVDRAAARGEFQPGADPRNWDLVLRVARRAIERHRRHAARLTNALAQLMFVSREADAPPETAERAELVLLVRELAASRPQDAQLVELRLRGKRWRDISIQLGIGEEAARQRWSAMLVRVRARIAPT